MKTSNLILMISSFLSLAFTSALTNRLILKNHSRYHHLCRTMSAVVENCQIVKERINTAATNANRNPNSIRLVAVSKTKPVESILELYQIGHRHFGENYFQELLEKAEQLPKDINWHFIGHLQSSKAAKIIKGVPNLFVLETIDSEKLAAKIQSACVNAGRLSLNVFIQVDTSGEESKSGVSQEELLALVDFLVSSCDRLKLIGLMTIGAPNDFSCFDKLVECRRIVAAHLHLDENKLELSMGMSGDFEEAVARGSTSVRIGSTIFGERIYPKK